MAALALRHPLPRLALGALLLLLLAWGLVRLAHLPAPAAPLDPHIPNEQRLIALGLSGVPGPGQPDGPIAVDRIVVDRTATYVQFHINGVISPMDSLLPRLYDDTGVLVGQGGSGELYPATWPIPLPSWCPWRPPAIQRGYVKLSPLPAHARAAVLRFDDGETVRVPLHLQALARRAAARPAATPSRPARTVPPGH